MDKENITNQASRDNLADDPLALRQISDTALTSSTTPSAAVNLRPRSSLPLLSQYNTKNPAVKRLMREAAEMACNDDPHIINAQPLEDNLFEWHYTFRGPPDTPYHGGIYHGRVCLPSQYPMQPPEITMITPNGRFETNTKICLSISSHHPETWQPSWSIRTAVVALRSFMGTDSPGAIGSVECSDSARRSMAASSHKFECCSCGCIAHILAPEPQEEDNKENDHEHERPEETNTDDGDGLPEGCEELLRMIGPNSQPQSVRTFGAPNSSKMLDTDTVVGAEATNGLEVRGGDTARQGFQEMFIDQGMHLNPMDPFHNLLFNDADIMPPEEQAQQTTVLMAIGVVIVFIGTIVARRLFFMNWW